MAELNINIGFEPSNYFIEKVSERKKLNKKSDLKFGVKYLDSCLGGISINDLVLLCGRSGSGKTELSIKIAMENAKKGHRVHFFALEATEGEIQDRYRYGLLAKELKKTGEIKKYPNLNYGDWINGKYEDATLNHVEKRIEITQIKNMKNLFTYYRRTEFTIDIFKKLFMAIQDCTDLVIIDHIHYFDSDEPNENKALKEIIKGIRDVALLIGKPIVLVCHIRKENKQFAKIVPELEDIHGTSDIGKIATKVISFAAAPDPFVNIENSWLTYFKVAKNRLDGSRTKFVGAVCFNSVLNDYLPGFRIGKLSENGKEFVELIGNQIPYWAR